MVFDFDLGHCQGVLIVISLYYVVCIMFIRLEASSDHSIEFLVVLYNFITIHYTYIYYLYCMPVLLYYIAFPPPKTLEEFAWQ